MNYSKSITKSSIGKRVLKSWIIIGVWAFLLGTGITVTVMKGSQAKFNNRMKGI